MCLMSPKAPYISATTECVLHTYILLLSAANTVLLLLVYKCVGLLNARRHTENKYP